MVYGLALAAGLGIPYAVLIAFGLLRYKLENLEELKQLTELPVIASVPTASEADKGKAGIVVHDGEMTQVGTGDGAILGERATLHVGEDRLIQRVDGKTIALGQTH